MNANDMTPAQLRELADKKEKESKPIKKGKLKFDLYNQKYVFIDVSDTSFWLYSTEEVQSKIDEFVEKAKSNFKLVLKKDTEFVCYLRDGQECWYDNVNYGIEEMNEEFASKYLTDIKKVEE